MPLQYEHIGSSPLSVSTFDAASASACDTRRSSIWLISKRASFFNAEVCSALKLLGFRSITQSVPKPWPSGVSNGAPA